MSNSQTRVETIFLKDSVHHYIRFGRPITKKSGPLYRGCEFFGPDQLLGYVQWHAGKYGSHLWRFIIIKTMHSDIGQHGFVKLQEIPGITPGAHMILDLEGTIKVRIALKAIDQIEDIGLDPADISESFYGHLHQRIATNLPYHRYTMAQHESFLKEKKGLR